MIEIDGSFGSGSGQILRTAGALAAATKKTCRIFNIRQNRPEPGLAFQHLLGIRALAELCGGSLKGDFLRSQEIEFQPSQTRKDAISIDIPTAGSIALVLQGLIPAVLSAPFPVKIVFQGGATDTFFSPTFDYFRSVFLKILETAGVKIEIKVLKRGYYPEGGAKVEVKIFPSKLKRLNFLDRGGFKKVLIISGASTALSDKKVSERQISGVKEILGKLKLPLEEKTEYYETQSPGSHVCLIAEYENALLGADNLGKLGKRAEDVGKEAALKLLSEEKSGACLDQYMADQILPYMALSSVKSQVVVSEITEHCRTNIWTIEKFLPGKFEIKGNLIKWLPF